MSRPTPGRRARTARVGAVLVTVAGLLASASGHTFVYVANYNNSTIAAFAERDKGALQALPSIRTPGGPECVVADRRGAVITADSLAHAVSAYRVAPGTGRLTPGSVYTEAAGANPFSLSASPGGRYIYVANSGNSSVGIFRLHAPARLAEVGMIHEAPGSEPYAVAITPNGRYAYVANFGNATIGMFRRRPAHGQLAALGLFHEPPGDGPYGLAIGPDGRFLYVADFRANVLLVLAIAKNGTLTLKDRVTEPFDHHPDSLVIDPSGRYLFVANTSANDISVFRIDQKTGRLTHVGRIPTGSYPFSLTLDSAARFVFAVNFGASTISRYRLDKHSGTLTAIGTTAEAAYADPYSIAALTIRHPAPAAPPLPEKLDNHRGSGGGRRQAGD